MIKFYFWLHGWVKRPLYNDYKKGEYVVALPCNTCRMWRVFRDCEESWCFYTFGETKSFLKRKHI